MGECRAKRTEVCCWGGGWRGEEEEAAAAEGSWGSSAGWSGGGAGCGVRGSCCWEEVGRRGGVETERRGPGEGEGYGEPRARWREPRCRATMLRRAVTSSGLPFGVGPLGVPPRDPRAPRALASAICCSMYAAAVCGRKLPVSTDGLGSGRGAASNSIALGFRVLPYWFSS